MKYISEILNTLLELGVLWLGYIIIKLVISEHFDLLTITFLLSFGISLILFSLISSLTGRMLDKKYKYKLYKHPNGKDMILTIIPLPNSLLVKIRIFRLLAYALLISAKRSKKGRFYRLQQEILPECSFENDLNIIDLILIYPFIITGILFFILGVIWIVHKYFFMKY